MGGQAGIRGYMVQTLSCLLEALRDPSWETVTLEPGGDSEQADIIWTYSNGSRKVVQVKSSENLIGMKDVEKWARQLEASIQADDYELRLWGTCRGQVLNTPQVGKVRVPRPHPLEFDSVLASTAHLLDKHFHALAIPAISPDQRELVIQALAWELTRSSEQGKRHSREGFNTWLQDSVRVLMEARNAQSIRVSTARLPSTGSEFFGREAELRLLDEAWNSSSTHIVSIVAWGGVGKSSLINHWLAGMDREQYRGAQRVYCWSFYSQGTRESVASADEFISSALSWFGDPEPARGSAWNKGERLANLIRREPTLLVLDGLEPLQNPPGPDEGKLKDPALTSLVRELATANPGLCIITTRYRVTDITKYEQSTVAAIALERLSDEAGVQLLRALEVQGTPEELNHAVREFDGHGLALTLLGTYLRDICSGDVRRVHEVKLLEEDSQGGHARRVMASYEKWFGEGPELAMLRLLGLFDRPAQLDLMNALRKPSTADRLTETLASVRAEPDWARTLARLRRARLVAEVDTHAPETLDTHPLVREYFGQKFKTSNPVAWRDGHHRLYVHLKQSVPGVPTTTEEMMRLYAAMYHGCQAGCQDEVVSEVYLRKVNKANFFSQKRLSGYTADLAAFQHFFRTPWTEPSAGLGRFGRVAIMSHAGSTLRALGRLSEAAQTLRSALDEAGEPRRDWFNMGSLLDQLSELHALLGELKQGQALSEQGIEISEEVGDPYHLSHHMAGLASILHQAGRWDEAGQLFRGAEKVTPKPHNLISLRGFQFCEFLLETGRHADAARRAAQLLETKTVGATNMRDVALAHLALGMAWVHKALQKRSANFSRAVEHLEQAVVRLHEEGEETLLPRALLARAGLHRLMGDLDGTRQKLDASMSIALRSGMRPYEVDTHLEYACLHLARHKHFEAREAVSHAKAMIGALGYFRRMKDAEVLEKAVEAQAP